MDLYNNNTVSVITPVYNVAKVIGRTLDSIFMQNYKDMEIILVDDCSEDNSADIISLYAAKYPNIVYHRQRYVAFLDSDDQWCEDKLVKQLAFMKEKDAAICCTAMDCIDENDEPLNSIRNVEERISYNFLLKNTMIATSTVLIDRNKTGNFQMPLRRGGQDYATWLMLMRNGTICYGLNEVLSHYRVMNNSLSSNKWKSIRQVWEIQNFDEGINSVSVAVNVCFFIINAFVKHFLK